MSSTQNLILKNYIYSLPSIKAYAAVAYLKNGSNVNFVMCKTHLNLNKNLTIPKFELLAILIATRLSKFLAKLNNNKSHVNPPTCEKWITDCSFYEFKNKKWTIDKRVRNELKLQE